MRELGVITELKICVKHVPAQPSFRLDKRTGAKLLGLGFFDISILFKNVRNLPSFPSPHKCHEQVELQLLAKRGWAGRSRTIRDVFIQSQATDHLEKSWQALSIYWPSSGSQQVMVSDLVHPADDGSLIHATSSV
jgi:hypothetical protein